MPCKQFGQVAIQQQELRARPSRVFLQLFLLIYLAAGSGASGADAPTLSLNDPQFSFQKLRDHARARAANEYHPDNKPELPDFLKKLNYDDYREIRFLEQQSQWHAERLPFEIQLFHRGYLFVDPVRIHLIEGGKVSDLQYAPAQFDYGRNQIPKPLPLDLQFAGLNLVYIRGVTNRSEVASFLGASYFRLVGVNQRYGASFRGLAINTAEPTGEEFPRFTELWVEKPAANANSIQLFALLDSPSCAGAFRFTITPGEITRAEVEACVFLRKDIAKLGVAPLTSMFLMGENKIRFVSDFRPEVHDSDGLLLLANDKQWLWRPLVNPLKKHQVSRFPLDSPAGFGLLQRDGDFHHYEDLVARYELRPSLWVEPSGNWGAGTAELVEIPSLAEGNDNIVAYWVPQEKATAGHEFYWKYQLSSILTGPAEPNLLRVESTRISPEHDKVPPRFVIEFGGAPAPSETTPLEVQAQTSRGEIKSLVIQRNDVTGGWRVFFDLAQAGNDPAELRLTLHQGQVVRSETWVYLHQNEPPL